MKIHILALSALLLGPLAMPRAQAQLLPYQLPPRAIAALADAPPMPQISFSPNGNWLLQLDQHELLTLADLGQPELRLAGLRINPAANSRSRMAYARMLRLRRLPDGKEVLVQGLPANARISNVQWSPDNNKIAFTHTTRTRLELWIVEVGSASARQVPNLSLNGVLGQPYEWVSDSKTLIARAVVGGRGTVPPPPEAAAAPVRTYDYPLLTPLDERRLDYYALNQVVRVGLDGRMAPLGQPGLIAQASPSPDGRYVLVRTYHRPYAYGQPLTRFPQRVQLLTMEGLVAKEVADLPATGPLPTTPDAVPAGPREFSWREDVPNTLFWVEAESGSANTAGTVHDRLLALPAPFEQPRELGTLPARLQRIYWSSEQLVLIGGRRQTDRQEGIWALDMAAGTPVQRLLEYSSQQTYTHPGTPALHRNQQGRPVLLIDGTGSTIYLLGQGASADGDRPFVDELNVRTRKTERWWRSEAPYYEQPLAILDPVERRFITRRESEQQGPNYYVRTGTSPQLQSLTQLPSPHDNLGSTPYKQLLRYQRPDGLLLTALLYLPAGYRKENGPLPTILEVAPTSSPDRLAAGQVRGSLHSYARYGWGSPLYWTSQGYAVLQNVVLPVLSATGQPTPAAYVQQLAQAATAALAEGQRLGFVDTARVAVLGQGRGAFLAANLLAHTHLFKAGIALTGTHAPLTLPLAGQPEQSGTWSAPEPTSLSVPFLFPDSVRTPLLVLPADLDGEAADFAGQNEQLYAATQRTMVRASYPTLPGEAHGYTARESLMQLLAEMNGWLSTHLGPGPAEPGKPN